MLEYKIEASSIISKMLWRVLNPFFILVGGKKFRYYTKIEGGNLLKIRTTFDYGILTYFTVEHEWKGQISLFPNSFIIS